MQKVLVIAPKGKMGNKTVATNLDKTIQTCIEV